MVWGFFWLNNANLHNFADYNTIWALSKDLQESIKKLENVSKYGMKWFTNNCMIVNPG